MLLARRGKTGGNGRRARKEAEVRGCWKEGRGMEHGGRGGQMDTGKRTQAVKERAERRNLKALWVFHSFHSSTLFTYILVIELYVYLLFFKI